jgi:SAM-dependent methyltransferase
MAKAAVQRALSAVPGGDRANYFLQRRVTRQIPRSEAHFRLHAKETIRHVRALRRHAPELDLAASSAYEFGAGWDLITPLLLRSLGVGHQTLVDIRANLHLDQVEHTLAQIEANRDWLVAEAGELELRPIDPAPLASVEDLERRYGIAYLAPRDARDTGLEAGSFDLISSTYTLEHIPADDIAAILRECARLLRPGGAVSAVIDMKDHYSYGDPGISAFNFLRYSDRTWRLVNSSLHYQNRLRASDYRRLFEDAGLRVLEEDLTPASEGDLATVRALPLAERFRGRAPEDLASREVHLVAVSGAGGRPRGGSPPSRRAAERAGS